MGNTSPTRLQHAGAPARTESALDDTDELIRTLVDAVQERNGRGGILMDLRGISDATDWFLIVSGDSDTHARAIADNLVERARQSGQRPIGIEGRAGGEWILIDFVTVVVHVFLPRVRDFYQLETLWGDAPSRRIE